MAYRKKVTHAREVFYILCILMVLLIGMFSIVGPGGYIEMKEDEAELAAQTAYVEALRKSIEVQLNTVNALRDNPAAIEEYARRKRYGRKGEVVQEVPEHEPLAPNTDRLRPAAPGARSGTRAK
jgi:cell division protein FtsB